MFCTRRAVSTTRTTLHGSLVSCRHACSRRAYSSRPIIPETSAPPSSSSSPQPPRSANGDGKKVTLRTLRRLYETKRPITFMTAHDYPSGLFVDRAGLDACLVGDSLAMVTLGYEHTSSVTVDEMLHHCRAVSRGVKRAFLVGDMPFGSYQTSPSDAVRNAVRFIQEGHVEAVKMEGGRRMSGTLRSLHDASIPVLGHVGLEPQSQVMYGGYKAQGKTVGSAMSILEDALAVQDAGCFAVVLEAVPSVVASAITECLDIPTIGIGAGKECSGQVLVQQDMLGIFDRFVPKFCKQYGKEGAAMVEALERYGEEVRTGTFPGIEHEYGMDEEEADKFLEALARRKAKQV